MATKTKRSVTLAIAYGATFNDGLDSRPQRKQHCCEIKLDYDEGSHRRPRGYFLKLTPFAQGSGFRTYCLSMLVDNPSRLIGETKRFSGKTMERWVDAFRAGNAELMTLAQKLYQQVQEQRPECELPDIASHNDMVQAIASGAWGERADV